MLHVSQRLVAQSAQSLMWCFGGGWYSGYLFLCSLRVPSLFGCLGILPRCAWMAWVSVVYVDIFLPPICACMAQYTMLHHRLCIQPSSLLHLCTGIPVQGLLGSGFMCCCHGAGRHWLAHMCAVVLMRGCARRCARCCGCSYHDHPLACICPPYLTPLFQLHTSVRSRLAESHPTLRSPWVRAGVLQAGIACRVGVRGLVLTAVLQ